jgi:DNA-binding transcriptional MerR regulator
MTSSTPLSIGDVAEQSGVSVKTLRHYDEIGLLTPSGRGDNGYRLYDDADIARLQQITSLKQLGFSLEQIGDFLRRPDVSPLGILEMHLTQMRSQLKHTQDALDRLDGLTRFLKGQRSVSAKAMLSAIHAMQETEKYYTEEELDEIHERGRELGREKIVAVENEWPQLIAQAKEAMEQNLDPASPAVQRIAKRWKELVDMFTGGNPAIEAKLKKAYTEKPATMQQAGGPDPEIMAFMGKALAVLQTKKA